MGNNRLHFILTQLQDNDYHTAQSLADSAGLSSKTIRAVLKEASELLKKENIGYIESKHGCGYKMAVYNKDSYKALIDILCFSSSSCNIQTSDTRIQYIMEYFLSNKGFVKIAALQDMLYISRNTLISDLKEAEKRLNRFDIKLIRRPNYGIKAVGNEFNFRMCIANFMLEKDGFNFGSSKHSMSITREIADCVMELLCEDHISMSDVAIQNLIVHIYVAMLRMIDGDFLSLNETSFKNNDLKKELAASKKLVEKLNGRFNISFPESEIGYIAIHLAGKKMRPLLEETGENTVISPRINNLVTDILYKANEIFKIDFKENIELRMTLCQHLLALEIRIKYGMNLKNPLLQDIKRQFSLAYAIAVQSSTVINSFYHTRLKDDEIGYIALAFALALERHKTTISRKNILLVCSTGKGSANLLKYKYKTEFSGYLNEVTTCDINMLNKVDYSKIDYIFTTVPIKMKVPVPIIEVGFFLDHSDILSVKQTLSRNLSKTPAVQYFSRELFIPCLDCQTKEDVLKQMCAFIHNKRILPPDFYESVMRRERLARTEFGNNVAMPHPDMPVSSETFICVAVLKEPVHWEDHNVQLVFLVSIENSESLHINNFYEVTAKLLLSTYCVNKIIKTRNYDVLKKLLTDIEDGTLYE